MKKIILLCVGLAIASQTVQASWLTAYLNNNAVITAFVVAAYHTLLLPAYFPTKNTFTEIEPEKKSAPTPKKLTYGPKSLLSKINNKTLYTQKQNVHLMPQTQRKALGEKAAIGITATAKTMQWDITPKQSA